MKYLKYLQTTNDFESFKNSEDYILPNVSYVVETEGVSFDPSINLYNFTISGLFPSRKFDFESGMTWGAWIDSKYNVDIPVSEYDDIQRKFIKDVDYPGFCGYIITDLDGNEVYLSDEIIATDYWFTK